MNIQTINVTNYQQVGALIKEAFTNTAQGYGEEAELVEKIRLEITYQPYLEIICCEADQIVGYGLLSEVYITNNAKTFTGLVLAPLAVSTKMQKKRYW